MRMEVELLRSRFLDGVNRRLGNRQIDNVLIQIILIAIDIDISLGYTDFMAAHLRALEVTLALRQRHTYSDIYSTALDNALSISSLLTIFQASLSIDFNVSPGSSPYTTSSFFDEVHKPNSSLPQGIESLAAAGFLSIDLLNTLTFFADHEREMTPAAASEFRLRCCTTGNSLTSLELSILIALSSVLDDLTATGDHIAVMSWTEPYKPVISLLDQTELWENQLLNDLLVWFVTALTTPKMIDKIPFSTQNDYQQRLLDHDPRLRSCEVIEGIYTQFFFPTAKLPLWRYAWEVKFRRS